MLEKPSKLPSFTEEEIKSLDTRVARKAGQGGTQWYSQ